MIVFPEMLTSAAEKAGIKVPPNAEEYQPRDYPHWHVFTIAQLGRAMPYAGCHWDNAKVVASIPEDRIAKVTIADLLDAGFSAAF